MKKIISALMTVIFFATVIKSSCQNNADISYPADEHPSKNVNPESFLGTWYDGGPTCMTITNLDKNTYQIEYGCYAIENPKLIYVFEDNALRNYHYGISYIMSIDNKKISEKVSKTIEMKGESNLYFPENDRTFERY